MTIAAAMGLTGEPVMAATNAMGLTGEPVMAATNAMGLTGEPVFDFLIVCVLVLGAVLIAMFRR